MALDPMTDGKAVADYIVANAPSPTAAVTPAQLEALWQGILGVVYAGIAAKGVITATIPADAIATVGGPAAQDGPPAPVNISGTIA